LVKEEQRKDERDREINKNVKNSTSDLFIFEKKNVCLTFVEMFILTEKKKRHKR